MGCRVEHYNRYNLWQKGIATTGGANDYFNHAYLDKNILYMSMQTNGLGGGGLRQGFVGIDTNGTLSSGIPFILELVVLIHQMQEWTLMF